MPTIIVDYYSTATFNAFSKFTGFIWALIPISLAFAVINKSKQMVLIILGGLYLLYGFYETIMQFIE